MSVTMGLNKKLTFQTPHFQSIKNKIKNTIIFK